MNDSKQTFNIRVIPRARKNEISLDENGVMDFHGEAVLYEDEKEKQRFKFSKGDSKSIGLYGDQKEKDI